MNASTQIKPLFPYDVMPDEEREIIISGSYAGQTSIAPQPYGRLYINIESATSKHVLGELLRRAIDDIFVSAKDEEFEYGQESNFSLQLDRMIHRYGFDALREIQIRFSEKSTHPDLVVEALHLLGRSKHAESRVHRLTTLIINLQAALPEIRCAAALGIAYMDDPQAIPTLERTLAREKSAYARVCLQRVLEQLQETQLQM